MAGSLGLSFSTLCLPYREQEGQEGAPRRSSPCLSPCGTLTRVISVLGARTHDPETKSHMLYRLSQPGAPVISCFKEQNERQPSPAVCTSLPKMAARRLRQDPN